MHAQITKQFIKVHDRTLAYVDRGKGPPIVFLHGNPTSSYLWRNITAPLSAHYRCVAPDLIGMGDSDKLPGVGDDRYSFFEHQRYLDGFLEGLRLQQPVVLVVHDWGSALGFDWLRRYPERVRGIAYMEAIVGPLEWSSLPAPVADTFRALRSTPGEEMILRHNFFVEQILPSGMLRKLTSEEHEEYRRPFHEVGEARRPTLAWPRQLPFSGEPREICDLVERYAAFLARSDVPKLFINAEPGIVLVGALRDACRRWPNQREVTVNGLHYVQEDSPNEIASAIRTFVSTLP
jgi:haloalkane dehalogenase